MEYLHCVVNGAVAAKTLRRAVPGRQLAGSAAWSAFMRGTAPAVPQSRREQTSALPYSAAAT